MEKGISVKLGLGLAFLSFFQLSPAYSNTKLENSPAHAPGQLLVKLKDGPAIQGMRAALVSSLLSRLGRQSVLDFKPLMTDRELHVLQLTRDGDVARALEILKTEPSVAYVEPNWIVHAYDDGAPNDPDFAKLWAMKNIGQSDADGHVGTAGADIGALRLWNEGITGSKNVLVAIIDTGIDWTHPDLVDNLYTNPGESGDKATNGKDDDGNGFIDDVHGYNFVAHNADSRDDQSHGTHCAGTIGAAGNNGIGVAGVNWHVSLMPVKFLDSNGSGTLEGAIESINYARIMKVNVMSNSWGGGSFSQAMADAITQAKEAGILFVAAAGNDSNDNDRAPSYPASYPIPNVISVAATNNSDEIATFSNYGAKGVHVAAPGVKIYSTVRGGLYDTYSGTSMATPHVSGAAALLWSTSPQLSFAEIKERLIRTSDPVRGLKKKVAAQGRLNVYNAVHNIVPPALDPDESKWLTQAVTVESPHPYAENSNLTFTVHIAGARMIRVHFDKIDVENSYDHVYVETTSGSVIEDLTGSRTDYISEYASGDTVIIRLKSDNTQNGYGFKIDQAQYIP